ncbi:uncharacterized protein TNCV_1602431 [Trichonephila clavipes]|nr:uncharacterized protein TNCV_1602431 [Trichonephila clavipes]
MEAGWSARRVARQLGRSDCVVRKCWDKWIREMSFTRRPGSERPRQTSRREDRYISFKRTGAQEVIRVAEQCDVNVHSLTHSRDHLHRVLDCEDI